MVEMMILLLLSTCPHPFVGVPRAYVPVCALSKRVQSPLAHVARRGEPGGVHEKSARAQDDPVGTTAAYRRLCNLESPRFSRDYSV